MSGITSLEWTAMLLVAASLLLTLQALACIKRSLGIHSEITRKALHIIMGTITLTFPWLFSDPYPVVLLALFTTAFLSILSPLSKHIAWHSVLDVKGRSSTGQLCFPLAVALLFTMSGGNTILYCIPIAILTLADAVSALVGLYYGTHRYATVDGEKSTEGSLAFFTVAFLATHIPLLLFTTLDRPQALCVGLIMGLLAMLVEGISWKGYDNLFIPLGAYLVLISHLYVSVDELLARLVVLLLLLLFTIAWRHNTTLNGSAVLGVALFSYFAYVTGGTGWMAMPLIVFASYRFLMPRRFWAIEGEHSVYGVLSVASTGVLWLLWAYHEGNPDYIYPYTIAFAAHSAIITIAHIRNNTLNSGRLHVIVWAIFKSWLLLFLPLVVITGVSRQSLLMALVAPFFIALPTLAFYLSQRNSEGPLTSKSRWLRQAAFAVAGSLLGLIPVAHLL